MLQTVPMQSLHFRAELFECSYSIHPRMLDKGHVLTEFHMVFLWVEALHTTWQQSASVAVPLLRFAFACLSIFTLLHRPRFSYICPTYTCCKGVLRGNVVLAKHFFSESSRFVKELFLLLPVLLHLFPAKSWRTHAEEQPGFRSSRHSSTAMCCPCVIHDELVELVKYSGNSFS